MHNYLVQFLSDLDLSEEEIQQLGQDLQVKEYKRHDILLEQGEVSRECFFVLKGCLRQYAVDEDGKETTYNFFTENQTAIIYRSYAQKIPSDYSIACVEDSVLIVGDFLNESAMFNKYPQLLEITRSFMEADLAKAQEGSAAFVSASPQERYVNLLNSRPDLVNRVPQHQLASYLGMTPESLSRIKKRTEQA